MADLTLAQIKDFVIVLVALLAFLVLLGNVIKTIKEWRTPGMTEAEWRKDVDEKLGKDNKRIASLEEGNRVICRGILAMLSHEINGNSNDKLLASQTEITNYLINK